MKKVAWIGTGVMGGQQAGHLAKAGYPVSAYTRRYEKLLPLQEQFGLTPCRTIGEAVADADFIFVMVGYPKDVEERSTYPQIIDSHRLNVGSMAELHFRRTKFMTALHKFQKKVENKLRRHA